MDSWRPGASIDTLHLRARLLTQVRAYFSSHNVVEVETPALGGHAVSDTFIASMRVIGADTDSRRGFLQSSPEYAMKRLLAAGLGDCFQLFRAFRDGEHGRRHNTEFTLLEWYRLGFDEHDLMCDVDRLLQRVAAAPVAEYLSYQAAFSTSLGIDPLAIDLATLQQMCREGAHCEMPPATISTCLQLLFSLRIEPKLGFRAPIFIYDFPAEQAALARISQHDPRLSSRFELYWQGVELANGFFELADSAEQRRRFEQDNHHRVVLGLPPIELDEKFLAALAHGLPDCAGVALGIDRLLLIMLGLDELDQVMAFSDRRT